MNYGIALLSVIPMRQEPKEQSEMVSQLLFGESYRILAWEEAWIRVLTQFDGYEGWIDRKMHKEITATSYNQYPNQHQHVLDSLIMSIERPGAAPQLIVAGSTLPGYKAHQNMLEIGNNTFHIRNTYGDFGTIGLSSVQHIAEQFLNTPYLWGGRSLFGFDCSGFVQVVYKIHGIPLKRDAAQQAGQGVKVISLADALPGDLAFFARDNGRIFHVGILLSPCEIIHCSGYVQKSRLDNTGIIDSESQRYTHSLCAINRML